MYIQCSVSELSSLYLYHTRMHTMCSSIVLLFVCLVWFSIQDFVKNHCPSLYRCFLVDLIIFLKSIHIWVQHIKKNTKSFNSLMFTHAPTYFCVLSCLFLDGSFWRYSSRALEPPKFTEFVGTPETMTRTREACFCY